MRCAASAKEGMRRTKEEAEQTRRAIMTAALQTFDRVGISRTTMEHVAKAAGVTRGAIYWHFNDKQAVLRAIRDEVSLPLVDRADFTLLHDRAADPLDRVQRFLIDVITAVDRDPHTRLACSVMSFKCEYVGELEPELAEYARKVEHARKSLLVAYSEARKQKKLRAGLTPQMAALETTVFLAGLMRLALLDEKPMHVRKHARALIAAHVEGRRA
jgi:TetR/AcrR family acrAB operon transcriptional repressor